MTAALRAGIRHFLKRPAVLGLASIAGLALLVYSTDYLVFRYRVTTNRQPYGQFTVNSYDAVPQKSGKTEFIFNPPEPQTCAHALFPRDGFVPCWYLQRHTEPRTNI